ncbi:MAG: Ig-like domain-containing protein [Ignavibacteriales bacterium]|nr:Ig-like domain-containing protein [Ignavibacteriales bacterium]
MLSCSSHTQLPFAPPVLLTLLLVSIVLSLGSCAGMRTPEGGPLDTTPPEIISVYPVPNTTNYSDKKIVLEFSEYVDRRSVEESIFISPTIGEMEFDWSGTEVEISFQNPLRKNTTYVVSIGTDVVDVNGRNRMAQSFPLAFSTGAQIDRASIHGNVSDPKPSGIMIFGYCLEGVNPDTLDPKKQKPDFLTQTGANGNYVLPHLAFGSYRIMAVRDETRNLLYDPETDAYAMAAGEITLSAIDSMKSHVDFLLATEDTTSPRLVSATPRDMKHILLAFSKPLDSLSIENGAFVVADTNRQVTIPVVSFFSDAGTRTSITLITQAQQKDSLYRVFATGVKDQHGHSLNPLASSKIFTGSGLPDTLPARCIESSVRDSGSVVVPAEPLIFAFNDALDTNSVLHAVHLTSIDSTAIPFSLQWDDPARFRIVPSTPLRPATRYLLTLSVGLLRDLSGNHYRDSSRVFKFQTFDPESFGSLQGTVTDDDATGPDRYVVVARNITGGNKEATLTMRRNKSFTLRPLTEGQYTVRAFQDVKQDGKYFAGRPYPFEKAARFTPFSDTVKIRARWPVEGLNLRLK